MKNLTQTVITTAGFTLLMGVAQAEIVTAKTNQSFVKAKQSKVISSCIDAIEKHHRKEARLFLNRAGQFRSGADRAFEIQGWVWKDGERVQVTHDCVVDVAGEGLNLSVNYSAKNDVAASPRNRSPKS